MVSYSRLNRLVCSCRICLRLIGLTYLAGNEGEQRTNSLPNRFQDEKHAPSNSTTHNTGSFLISALPKPHLPHACIRADSSGSVLNANGLANVFLVGAGRTLTFRNLILKGFAKADAYRYDPVAAPYQLAGSGLGVWPTVDLAPNSTVSSTASKI